MGILSYILKYAFLHIKEHFEGDPFGHNFLDISSFCSTCIPFDGT